MQIKLKIIILLLFISVQNYYSQAIFKGIVKSDFLPLDNVEVINVSQKKVYITKYDGVFEIKGKTNDEIIFYLKGYEYYRLKLNAVHFSESNTIVLKKESILLEEVKVVNAPKIKFKSNYETLKTAKIEKESRNAKVIGVYTGEMSNGIDFMEIGRKMGTLVKKLIKKEDNMMKYNKIKFATYVDNHFDKDFFIQKLNLQSDDIDLFLTFCEKDTSSANVCSKNGELDVLQFLIQKRKEFK